MRSDTEGRGIRRWARWLDGLVVSLGLAVVGLIDFVTGAEVQVVSLYFLPLAFAAWRLGAASAVFASMLSTIVWLAALYANGTRYQSDAVWAINFVTQAVAFTTVSLLVSTLSAKLRQEAFLRRTDTLTSLLNRQAFLDQAGTALSLCRRHGHSCALAFIDLDNFKQANDRFGHAHGDDLLRTCGEILIASVRASDITARLGGDEFVVFLPQASHDDAVAVAQRVLDAIVRSADFGAAGVTASVGLVVDARSAVALQELLGRADRQMYRAKEQGKNRLVA